VRPPAGFTFDHARGVDPRRTGEIAAGLDEQPARAELGHARATFRKCFHGPREHRAVERAFA
jgi:hypothetical protein